MCNSSTNTIVRSFIEDKPHLLKEWNFIKNQNINPYEVTKGSNKKYWWICEKGHEWEASMNNRSGGTKCPYCSNRLVCDDNSLETCAPDVAKDWHPKKNGLLTPSQVLSGTSKKFWWICSKNHEWEASCESRVLKGTGCPYCKGRKACKENSLASLHPDVANEWHPSKNGNKTPNNVTAGSGKHAWWQCSFGHEWEAVINSRTSGSGCPTCNQQSQTSIPEQYLFFYLKKVFRNIHNRHRVYKGEKYMEVDLFIPSLSCAIEYDGSYYHKDRTSQDENKNLFLEEQNIKLIRIREKGLPAINMNSHYSFEYEYLNSLSNFDTCLHMLFALLKEHFSLSPAVLKKMDNLSIHPDKDKKHIFKQIHMQKVENSLMQVNPVVSKEWNYEKNGNLTPETAAPNSNHRVWWKCEKGHEWITSINNRSNGRNCPYCSGKMVCIDNCLATVNPVLAAEWNKELNEGLTPYDVTVASNKKVWWTCHKNHSWQTSVWHRSEGDGCPYCSNRKACKDNSLIDNFPQVALLWHPTKNKVKPSEIVHSSYKKAWWICPKGHEYEKAVYQQVNRKCCIHC